MGRLANLSYRKVVEKLKKLGFEFYRQAAVSHEIWYNQKKSIYNYSQSLG
jgi:predicted RNA binding protein YcfA (HicA-like mRNA interferase family)